MAVEEGADLHVQSVVLDDEPQPWDAARLLALRKALRDAGASPGGSFPREVETEVNVPMTTPSGSHTLRLEPTGAWWWTAPYATLMEDPHTVRPEAAGEVVAALTALVSVAPPYFATTWWSPFAAPFWMRADRPFAAEGAGAVTFLSRRYLDTHLGGRPLPRPPATSRRLVDGQLFVVDDGWASHRRTRPLGDKLMTLSHRRAGRPRRKDL